MDNQLLFGIKKICRRQDNCTICPFMVMSGAKKRIASCMFTDFEPRYWEIDKIVEVTKSFSV